MITYATAQDIGDRPAQCDATAVATESGARAWVLLDGIGTTPEVQAWTHEKARVLARVAAVTRSPEAAIAAARTVSQSDGYEDEYRPPDAVAVIAVCTADGRLRVGWAGDARAYWMPTGGALEKLTADHNEAEARRARGETNIPPNDRHLITASLRRYDGEEAEIGTARPLRAQGGRLLLVSDGTYAPFEDNGIDMSVPLAQTTPRGAASALVRTAVSFTGKRRDNATAMVVQFG
ncbi:PP2C family protein-serine/threonine phosphatase [Streptomyces sp. NPDC002817]|uniref:PP2C family protein-serine/threonine phosphatase n=1 Tax=Streptomyces sp. NPDC088357 TaxID=3154655 RepID=UPI00343485D6